MKDLRPPLLIEEWDWKIKQEVANSLRQKFSELVFQMRQPYDWNILYEYFDSYDVYVYGANNLCNVLGKLYTENQVILSNPEIKARYNVGMWVNRWLREPFNKEKLMAWSERHGPKIFIILDQRVDVPQLQYWSQFDWWLLERALMYRHYISKLIEKGRFVQGPRSLDGCLGVGVENWLGKFAAMSVKKMEC